MRETCREISKCAKTALCTVMIRFASGTYLATASSYFAYGHQGFQDFFGIWTVTMPKAMGDSV